MRETIKIITLLFLAIISKSQKCPDSCSRCESSTSCLECVEGYSFVGQNTCKKCEIENCKLCDSSLKSCTKCSSGFYSDTGECKICGRYCSECESPSKCLACKPLYSPTNNGDCYFMWWIPFLLVPLAILWITDFIIYRPWKAISQIPKKQN